jgi:biotin transport system permease protein
MRTAKEQTGERQVQGKNANFRGARQTPSPWSYRKGATLPHRLPAGLKLSLLFALSLGAFIPHPAPPAAAGLTVLLGALAAKIKPWELLRGGRPLLLMTTLVSLFRSLDTGPEGFPLYLKAEGLLSGLRFGLRLGISFSAAALLFAVTTMTELRRSLVKLETLPSALGIEIPALKNHYFSLGISLMLGFLPRFFETWENASLAWECRRAAGSLRSLKKLTVLIPLVTEKMIEIAAETALALRLRFPTQP